jgi:hypothetical protein
MTLTIRVASWPISCEMISSGETTGPKPTLFSPEPEATRSSIADSGSQMEADLSRIYRALLTFESVNMAEARQLIYTPREAASRAPFKKPRGGKSKAGPASKKTKLASTSGTTILLMLFKMYRNSNSIYVNKRN